MPIDSASYSRQGDAPPIEGYPRVELHLTISPAQSIPSVPSTRDPGESDFERAAQTISPVLVLSQELRGCRY